MVNTDSLPDLDRKAARKIIDRIGSSGQPPTYGLQYFTVGLDEYLEVIDEEYLSDFIPDGGAAFKMVVGVYGGGKTHFLYNIRDLAWKNNFAVSYVSLKSSGECPFYKLELVYKAIVNGLVPPLPQEELSEDYEEGIAPFLTAWYARQVIEYQKQGLPERERRNSILAGLKDLETSSVSFANAVRAALGTYIDKRSNDFETICQWLKGEGYDSKVHRKYNILQRIDKTTAFQMIRSLVQTVRHIGYSGLVVLLDEAERFSSLSTKQREQHLSNLREIIDECGSPNFRGMMFFYAVPDANFLEGRTQIYEALKQRLSTTFHEVNHTGVQIKLERTVSEPLVFLQEVGQKLTDIYEIAYSCSLDESEAEQVIDLVSNWAYTQRFSDEGYKRPFIQKLILGLNMLRKQGRVLSVDELESVG